MSALSYLKGVRTRYRNCIESEIKQGVSILYGKVPKGEETEYVLKASKCAEKIKLYVNKLEIQSDKVASSIEEDKTEEIEKIVEEDCKLCAEATDCFLELEQFKTRLTEFIKSETSEPKENVSTVQMIELQREMKDIVQEQIRQQQQLLEKQNKRESDDSFVKLPKIEIVSFNGKKTKWVEFWDSFESTIDKNKRLSEVEKFNYLRGKLEGEAKRTISGLTLSKENYSVAIKILKERFGNIQDAVDLHYSELLNLQPASNKTSSLRNFLDQINRHLRSLEVLQQDVNQDILVSMMKSKLPNEVLLQLEIQKGSQEKWTVSTLCDKLRKYVVARENSEKQEVPKERNGIHERQSEQVQTRTFQNKFPKYQRRFQPLSSTEALVASANKRSESGNYFDKCRYCTQQHWSDECPNFRSIAEREK